MSSPGLRLVVVDELVARRSRPGRLGRRTGRPRGAPRIPDGEFGDTRYRRGDDDIVDPAADALAAEAADMHGSKDVYNHYPTHIGRMQLRPVPTLQPAQAGLPDGRAIRAAARRRRRAVADQRPRDLDLELDDLHLSVLTLATHYESLASQPLAARAFAMQDTADMLLLERRRLALSQQVQLFGDSALLAAVTANVMFDMGDYMTSRQLCLSALTLAKELYYRGRPLTETVGEVRAWAYLTFGTALCYDNMVSPENYRIALSYAMKAVEVAGNSSPIAARTLSSLAARCHATLAERSGLYQTIGEADRIVEGLDSSRYGYPGRFLFTLHPADHRAHAAGALAIANDPSSFAQYASAAIADIDHIGPSGLRAMVRIDEAMVELQKPQVDLVRACEVAATAIQDTAQMPSTWVVARLIQFLRVARSLGFENELSIERLEELVHARAKRSS